MAPGPGTSMVLSAPPDPVVDDADPEQPEAEEADAGPPPDIITNVAATAAVRNDLRTHARNVGSHIMTAPICRYRFF